MTDPNDGSDSSAIMAGPTASGAPIMFMSRRMIRASLALLLSLALAGCFPPVLTSRHVEFPLEQRAIDPQLEGTYWLAQGQHANQGFSMACIFADGDRRYHVVYRDDGGEIENGTGNGETARGILIETRHPGLGVFAYQVDEQTAYLLLLRSRGGSLVAFPFLGDLRSRFGNGREEVLSEVARRHGLSLATVGNESDETRLTGQVTPDNLAALFNDPHFLGSLQLDESEGFRLFPANKPLPSLSDPDAWWPSLWPSQLTSARFAIAADQLVQPREFIGSFRHGSLDAKVTAQPDGSLLIGYSAQRSEAFIPEPIRLRILPKAQGESYIGLLESEVRSVGDQEPARLDYEFYFVTPGQGGGMQLSPIRIAVHDVSPLLNRMTSDVRRKALDQYRLQLNGDGELSGDLSARSLRGLFDDPWFQAGLDLTLEQVWAEFEPYKGTSRPEPIAGTQVP